MNKKTRYFVIAPDGTKHYRVSGHKYTIACMVQNIDGYWEVYSFSSTMLNIQKYVGRAKRRRIYKHHYDKDGEFLFDEDKGPLYLNVLLVEVQIAE
jgi:hypothetical protein